MECVRARLHRTKEEFGDIQLHVEWASPTRVQETVRAAATAGVPDGLVRCSADNYNNPTYADGFAASVYG